MWAGARLTVKGKFSILSGSRVRILENAHLILGSGYINYNLMLVCHKKIQIGENVCIGPNAVIRDSDVHSIASEPNYSPTMPIEIGDHVWIGENVTILKGVKIGNGAVIGAGSLVNKDIPDNTLAVGVPAKVIKKKVVWR